MATPLSTAQTCAPEVATRVNEHSATLDAGTAASDLRAYLLTAFPRGGPQFLFNAVQTTGLAGNNNTLKLQADGNNAEFSLADFVVNEDGSGTISVFYTLATDDEGNVTTTAQELLTSLQVAGIVPAFWTGSIVSGTPTNPLGVSPNTVWVGEFTAGGSVDALPAVWIPPSFIRSEDYVNDALDFIANNGRIFANTDAMCSSPDFGSFDPFGLLTIPREGDYIMAAQTQFAQADGTTLTGAVLQMVLNADGNLGQAVVSSSSGTIRVANVWHLYAGDQIEFRVSGEGTFGDPELIEIIHSFMYVGLITTGGNAAVFWNDSDDAPGGTGLYMLGFVQDDGADPATNFKELLVSTYTP